MKSPEWQPSKKLKSLMNRYIRLNAEYLVTRNKKLEQELFIIKTDVLNNLFAEGL